MWRSTATKPRPGRCTPHRWKTLWTRLTAAQISTIYTPNNEYWVMLELAAAIPDGLPQRSPCSTSDSSGGQLVPLNAVSKLIRDARPAGVNHSGQLPSVTVSFNLKPGMALGDAVNAVEDMRPRQLRCPPPHRNFEGTARHFRIPSAAERSAGDHHPGDLHRAGDSVRELHPSADDSFRPALGGAGRPAHADRCSTWNSTSTDLSASSCWSAS